MKKLLLLFVCMIALCTSVVYAYKNPVTSQTAEIILLNNSGKTLEIIPYIINTQHACTALITLPQNRSITLVNSAIDEACKKEFVENGLQLRYRCYKNAVSRTSAADLKLAIVGPNRKISDSDDSGRARNSSDKTFTITAAQTPGVLADGTCVQLPATGSTPK